MENRNHITVHLNLKVQKLRGEKKLERAALKGIKITKFLAVISNLSAKNWDVVSLQASLKVSFTLKKPLMVGQNKTRRDLKLPNLLV
jgi:hypothetical protein